MRVYLDVCCLNRPFDDQRQDRVRQEAEAVLTILGHVQNGEWTLVGSEVVLAEADANPDRLRRSRVGALARLASTTVIIAPLDLRRARSLESMGFGGMDALHLACAEKARVDAFLTTDEGILRCAGRNEGVLRVLAANPARWVWEVSGP